MLMFVLRILVLLLLLGIWMKRYRLVARPTCGSWHLDTAVFLSEERTKFVLRRSLLGQPFTLCLHVLRRR